MIKGFWKKLTLPIIALAPMADVTDAAFRRTIAKYGKPDVIWTEFVSADGLCSKGEAKLLPDLWFDESERPIVAQLFTSQPDHMEKAARLVAKLGYDGIDINMGCPDKSVEKQNAGAALIKNPKLAQKLIFAAMKGAQSAGRRIPVSVKTRIGYDKEILARWLPYILKTKPAAVTVHLRTRQEMSKSPAHWELMPEVLRLRDKYSPGTLILGNGDVLDSNDAKNKLKRYGGDGVMIGRGFFGTPWLLAKNSPTVSKKYRLKILLEHAKLFEKLFKKIKRFDVMKKHFKAYVSGFDGAKELRIKLMSAKDSKDVARIIGRGI